VACSRLPSWIAAFVPNIFYVTEKAWNFYPHTITEYTVSCWLHCCLPLPRLIYGTVHDTARVMLRAPYVHRIIIFAVLGTQRQLYICRWAYVGFLSFRAVTVSLFHFRFSSVRALHKIVGFGSVFSYSLAKNLLRVPC